MGVLRKILPLLSKRPSFFPGSQMGSTLPLPHIGSDTDLHFASYASIFKPSEVLLPPASKSPSPLSFDLMISDSQVPPSK